MEFNMDNIREILGNSIMAYTNMDVNVNGKEIVKNIFDILKEDWKSILKANKIDVKNDNGFNIDEELINKIKNDPWGVRAVLNI